MPDANLHEAWEEFLDFPFIPVHLFLNKFSS
jgi:hypothetical protein